jgi:hypothetical protein
MKQAVELVAKSERQDVGAYVTSLLRTHLCENENKGPAIRQLGSRSKSELEAAESPRQRKSSSVMLRLPTKLKQAAVSAAEEDSRTLSSLLRKLLKENLAAKGYLR